MSVKNCDYRGRFRSKIVSFRMSPEESVLLDRKVKMSGMKKQDYLIQCVNNLQIVIYGNPYVYRSLKRELEIYIQLFNEIQHLDELDVDDLEILEYMLEIIRNLKNKKEAQIKARKDTF